MKITTFAFLEDDYQDFLKKIQELEEELDKTLGEIGDSTDDSGNTWHDNFAFEEGNRKADMVSKRLRDLTAIRRRAEVVKPSPNRGEVILGRKVTFRDEETGEVKIQKIGSYLISGSTKDSISYNSPLAQLLMFGKTSEVKTGEIAGKEKKFKILKIE